MLLRIAVKGIVLGAVMFLTFNVAYFRAWDMWPSQSRAVGLAALKALTVQNTLYWIAGVLMLVLGCIIMAMWPVKVSP